MRLKTKLLIAIVSASPSLLAASPSDTDKVHAGWNILNAPYTSGSPVDGFTFEWQYFMVHDRDGKFTGSIGFVLADPKGRLGKPSNDGAIVPSEIPSLPFSVMPSGASVAVAGKWADGSWLSNYERLQQSPSIAADGKGFQAKDDKQGFFAALNELETVTPAGGQFELKGKTKDAAWDLKITPEWTERATDQAGVPFGPITGYDMGHLPGEKWTVHMQWPRTQVEGTITNLITGQTIEVSGHGYRENSWGRWNFAIDGWAFSVVSDAAHKVQWAWQSYHKSKTTDWLDVSFEDRGRLVKRRLFAHADELRWTMSDWKFNQEARQCVPNKIEVTAEDADYRIKASYDLSKDQTPMLSSATPLTKIFVIMIHTPYIRGTIENAKTGALITSFEGQGGGEFSTIRSVRGAVDDKGCARFGEKFNHEYEAIKRGAN
ncbi:MAG: hypothetical protein FJ146_15865 [Deltaproteobacteria bacterium]|nr:hypothetical protein [Deltaproteobacteria bacterium]